MESFTPMTPSLNHRIDWKRPAAIALLCLPAALCLLATSLASAQLEERAYVLVGAQGNVAYEGDPWTGGDGYLEATGTGRALNATDAIKPGDFTISARVSIEAFVADAGDPGETQLPGGGSITLRVAGQDPQQASESENPADWPAFVFDGNAFYFDSSHDGKIVIDGPDLGKRRMLPIRSRDYLTPGKPVIFQLIRKDRKLVFVIDDRILHIAEAPSGGIAQFGLRPGKSVMRLYGFNAKGNLETHGSGTPTHLTLWQAGQGGYASYRIPSLLALPGGVVLAFCEGRKRGVSDSGDIDLLMRRSIDGGVSWDAQRVIWDDAENTCGNPCPVFDDSTGTVVMLMTHNPGEISEAKIVQGEGARTVWQTSSPDLGETWTTPTEITTQVKRPDWTWYATGPGVGIQLTQGAYAGRLVIPCDHNTPGDPIGIYSHVVYSDDHGTTWTIGGVTDNGVNECQVIEKNGGDLLLNMRRGRGNTATNRLIADSSNGGIDWSELREDSALPEPECQASLIRVAPPVADKGGTDRLLFSNPADPAERIRMTVRLSEDGGQTWQRGNMLHDGPSAYSCLTMLTPETAACLYESGKRNPYETIRLARFGLDWLK
jgi:sialidase-1